VELKTSVTRVGKELVEVERLDVSSAVEDVGSELSTLLVEEKSSLLRVDELDTEMSVVKLELSVVDVEITDDVDVAETISVFKEETATKVLDSNTLVDVETLEVLEEILEDVVLLRPSLDVEVMISVGKLELDVDDGTIEEDVEEGPQAPTMEGTASTPFPIATRFVPQFAALANRRFWLS
jgi:hypothetical protein